MKTSIKTLALVTTLTLPSLAFAEVVSVNSGANAQGGFVGPNQGAALIESVEQVKQGKDDAKVVLTGKIKTALGDEEYTFIDGSGEITVEIDDNKWQGRTVTTENTVVLYGEVDKDWNSLTVDVDRLEVK